MLSTPLPVYLKLPDPAAAVHLDHNVLSRVNETGRNRKAQPEILLKFPDIQTNEQHCAVRKGLFEII